VTEPTPCLLHMMSAIERINFDFPVPVKDIHKINK
jgi:hypothetical protein